MFNNIDELEKEIQEFQDNIIASNKLIQTLQDVIDCLLYTSPSPRDGLLSRMPSSA